MFQQVHINVWATPSSYLLMLHTQFLSKIHTFIVNDILNHTAGRLNKAKIKE